MPWLSALLMLLALALRPPFRGYLSVAGGAPALLWFEHVLGYPSTSPHLCLSLRITLLSFLQAASLSAVHSCLTERVP